MIIILKRDNLPPEHRPLAGEELKLDYGVLSSQLIHQAELIVFVG